MLTIFLDYQRAVPKYQPAVLLSEIEELQSRHDLGSDEFEEWR
jgi:hypothetical protein